MARAWLTRCSSTHTAMRHACIHAQAHPLTTKLDKHLTHAPGKHTTHYKSTTRARSPANAATRVRFCLSLVSKPPPQHLQPQERCVRMARFQQQHKHAGSLPYHMAVRVMPSHGVHAHHSPCAQHGTARACCSAGRATLCRACKPLHCPHAAERLWRDAMASRTAGQQANSKSTAGGRSSSPAAAGAGCHAAATPTPPHPNAREPTRGTAHGLRCAGAAIGCCGHNAAHTRPATAIRMREQPWCRRCQQCNCSRREWRGQQRAQRTHTCAHNVQACTQNCAHAKCTAAASRR